MNSGAYGSLLAGCECTCGRYPLTLAFLKLMSNMVQVSGILIRLSWVLILTFNETYVLWSRRLMLFCK